MKSLHTIQKLSKLGEILSKTAFIFAVIGVVDASQECSVWVLETENCSESVLLLCVG